MTLYPYDNNNEETTYDWEQEYPELEDLTDF